MTSVFAPLVEDSNDNDVLTQRIVQITKAQTPEEAKALISRAR
jgi:hypothetical protein